MMLRDLKPGEEFTLRPTQHGDCANPKRVMVVLEHLHGYTIFDKLANMHKPGYDGLDSFAIPDETRCYIRGVAFHLNRFCQHERMKYPFYPEG